PPRCEVVASAPSPIIVTINTNQTFQTIDGFGAAQHGGDTSKPSQDAATPLYNWAMTYPESGQKIMDLVFSPEKGIGLSMLRIGINAMINPRPGEFQVKDTAQSWVMKQALLRGPVKIFASAWSPPAWMKTNGDTIGGALIRPGR